MENKANRGERPRNVKYEELKKVVDDYFLYVAEGDASLLSKKGRYSRLAEYANNRGMDYKATDFSRCKQLLCYLDDLTKRYLDTEQPLSLNIPGYAPLDIDYLLRPDLTRQERMQLLMEQEKRYQRLHVSAAKALEVYDSQQKEINDLRVRLQVEIHKNSNEVQKIQIVKLEYRKLTNENRYLKRYIREYIEPAVAEAMLTGHYLDKLTNRAVSLMPPKSKETALASLTEFLSSDKIIASDEDEIDYMLSRIGEGLKHDGKKD